MVESLAGVPAGRWNELSSGDPFTSHEFLSALMDTGCASARSGWRPQIVLLEKEGRLAGAMPLFLKSHSYGEYVFDWAWADAYQRHGLEYYPKLLCAVPFTPVAGARLLAADPADRAALIQTALELGRHAGEGFDHSKAFGCHRGIIELGQPDQTQTPDLPEEPP